MHSLNCRHEFAQRFHITSIIQDVKDQVDEKHDKDCCSNEKLEVKNLDEDSVMSQDINLTNIQLKFVTSFVYTFNGIKVPRAEKSEFIENYAPAPSKDIYVLLERYLI